MTRREEVAALCRDGLSPAEIANRLGLRMYDVKTHLHTQVGEGAIRRSDVLFTIPEEQRREFEVLISCSPTGQYWDLINSADAAGYEQETFRLYLDFRGARVWRGDLYEYIADVELYFHDIIRRKLVERFGDGEAGWWRQGVPATVRTQCVTSRENDPTPAEDPFAYTTFIHLGEIIEKHWEAFASTLPEVLTQSKKDFSASFRRLNRIRNAVMHPCKNIVPTEDDFLFVRSLWRVCSAGRPGTGNI